MTRTGRWFGTLGAVLICVALRYTLEPDYHPITWVLGCLAGIAIGAAVARG